MELPVIPEKLEEFDLSLLNKLTKILSVESDTFDFKLKPSNLHEDFCAMANNKGGYIVLGIDQILGKDGKTILEFKKIGFPKGQEDLIGNQINNYRFNVEPIPAVSINHIYENDVFYTVLKIESKISDRPYFIKDTGQCYVRLHSSSQRVGRATILNLFSASVEMIKTVKILQSTATRLKDSLIRNSNLIEKANPEWYHRIPPVDLSLMTNAVISAEWFLDEKRLFDLASYQEFDGINSVVHNLEVMNSYIISYNETEAGTEEKFEIRKRLNHWTLKHSNFVTTIQILNNLRTACNEFLSKYI